MEPVVTIILIVGLFTIIFVAWLYNSELTQKDKLIEELEQKNYDLNNSLISCQNNLRVCLRSEEY